MYIKIHTVLGLFVLFFSCHKMVTVRITQGMVIDKNIKIKPGNYFFEMTPDSELENPLITITGHDLDIDFSDVYLQGSSEMQSPDQFKGLAVLIQNASKVTVRNLHAKGFKVVLYAEGVDSLSIFNCDFSYNYRQRLMSRRERENLSDWLYYHHNEHDEWLRYGAAVYLKSCKHARVEQLEVTQGQNGLMLVDCHHGTFVNNTIRFNSGVGIGMYRSSDNRIMYNRLDWNVRGYSHGIYQRGQDSAGILIYEQSSGNVIAYNSATHSGDGLFLWAGQETMDSGTGGCNENFIYKNDLSYAPANGVEATFSSNWIIGNEMRECRYGIWGGYSYLTTVRENEIADCDYGIAIEHGNRILIERNFIEKCSIGIHLWERETQPVDWGFSSRRDVSSRQYVLTGNRIERTAVPIQVDNTESVCDESPPDFGMPSIPDLVVPPPRDSATVFLDSLTLQGRKYILVDEWGPYNFAYPAIWLRNADGEAYVFTLFGPVGNWRLDGAKGFVTGNPRSGTFPATFVATRDVNAELLELEFEFIGSEHVNRFGDTIRRGVSVPFIFHEFKPVIEWDVRFYNCKSGSFPINQYNLFKSLQSSKPVYREQSNELTYTWWDTPAEAIQSDKFAVFASGKGYFDQGNYKIYITSDDGYKLYVDGNLVMERWDIHDPVTDWEVMPLEGHVEFLIEYFNSGGLGNLEFIADIHVN